MKWQKYGAIQNVRHSGKRGGKVDKKVTKSDAGEGFAAKNCDATHLKKNTRFCEWRSFWMTPMVMFYFAVFFMSVFVDDVISFLFNK